MKLKCINNDMKKFGFPSCVNSDNNNFNGHQIGVAICMMNAETNAIEANYLDKALGTEQERDMILKKLLNKKTITLATDTITQYNDNTDQFESKLLYFMPYIPVNHSRLKPTVTTYNTSIH